MTKSSINQIVPVSKLYSKYVLFVLTLVYVFNFIDRQILVILQESIKIDLQLSDTQLGLLSGFTFAIFYVTMGIPIARLADRSNRRNIVALSLTVWSGMTALSGFAQNFIQLLLARIGVGIGEAGGSPPAHSMISDYFRPEKRATALSIYSTGIYIGILIGYPLGGWLNAEYGWRVAFFVLGLPGVLVAVLLYLTVKEPMRGAMEMSSSTDRSTFKEVLSHLFSKKAFVFLAAATGFQTFCNYGVGNWLPSFLIRSHGVDSAEVGLWLGLIIGVGGAVGTYLGGVIADRLGKQDKSWYFKLSAIGAVVSLPMMAIAFFNSSTTLVLVSLGIVNISTAMYLGPSIAITHSMVPAHMRALSSAILFFVLNLVGLGLGPLVIGVISDALASSLGADSLRWALTISFVMTIGAAMLFLQASKHIERDLHH